MTGNTVTNSDLTDPNVGSALYISGNKAATVDGNTVTGGAASGVRITETYGTNSGVTVNGNTIADRSNGIYATGTSTGVSLTDNTVTNSSAGGIRIDSGIAGATISANSATASASDDCVDNTTGGGTAGTANTWTNDVGATSVPAGLCTEAAPTITSPAAQTVATGRPADLRITATGTPTPTVTVTASNGVSPDATQTLVITVVNGYGYRLALVNGHTYAFGALTHYPAQKVGPGTTVGVADDPSSGGYWETNSTGTVTAVNAPALGGLTSPATPVVAIAATPSGSGYWMLTANGNVHAFGDARTYPPTPVAASVSAVTPTPKAVGIAPSADGGGYFVAYANGSVTGHGDAGRSSINSIGTSPAVAIATDDATGGYWLAQADGSVIAVNAPAEAPVTVGAKPGSPAVAIVAPRAGTGFWLVAARGGVFAHGSLPFLGVGPTSPATSSGTP